MPAKHNRRHSKRVRANSYDSEDRADVISISSTEPEPTECNDNSSAHSNQPLLVKIKKEPGVSDDEEEVE